MTRPVTILAALAVLVVGITPSAGRGQGTATPAPLRELDFRNDGRQFDLLFRRSGTRPTRYIVPERNGIRFQIPAVKEGAIVGYNSSFALAGDFSIQVDFQLVQFDVPEKGYGTSIGLSIDAEGKVGAMSLVRSIDTAGNEGLSVVRAIPGEKLGYDNMQYEFRNFPTTVKTGRLLLRREKEIVICFAAWDLKSEPLELTRWEFTDKRVKAVKFHADTGGSPTPLSARLTNILITADEIVGGLTPTELSDTRSYWWWWIPVAGMFFVAAWFIRVRRRRAENDTED